MDVSFTTGLSGISHINTDVVDRDFPKNKSSFKPSGESISAHFWKALGMGRTFQNREKNYALGTAEKGPTYSPEEHQMMTHQALKLFGHHAEKWPEAQSAFAVLEESRELQQYLNLTRNVLVSG